MVKTIAAAAAAFALALAGAAAAQDGAQPPAAPQVPTDACASAAHHGFDFWIGEWDVRRTGADAVSGASSIGSEDQGCVITEHFRSLTAPYSGRSLNMFDAAAGKWFQYWMDSTGDITRFEGGLNEAGQMVLVAANDVGPGQPEPQFQRMTFTPNPDGSVRQHGESSPDGETWTTTYDLTYRRRE
ncbi:MAG: hypothetical protein GC206_00140 [Alphaproteobacteria bacterium]|nr:hypothetical protein [Alphaproteobacteria bacterium]